MHDPHAKRDHPDQHEPHDEAALAAMDTADARGATGGRHGFLPACHDRHSSVQPVAPAVNHIAPARKSAAGPA